MAVLMCLSAYLKLYQEGKTYKHDNNISFSLFLYGPYVVVKTSFSYFETIEIFTIKY